MTEKINKKILLVEDESIIAVSEKFSLEKYGFSVIIAGTGEEAVDIYRNDQSINLVLMDINLGYGIDGTAAAMEMLKIRETPIIFLSSHTEPEIVKKTEGITSYGYVVKNSGETLLNASINMAFRLFEAREKERKKDIELHESEHKVRLIFNSMDDSIFIHPYAEKGFGNIEEVNNTACRKYGYTREEFSEMTVENITKEIADSNYSPEKCKTVISRGSRSKFDAVHISKDGKEMPVAITSVLIELKGEKKILTTVRDISDYRKQEEKNILFEEGYSNLIEGINEPVWIIDFDSSLIDVNKKAYATLGYSKEELLKTGLYKIDKSLSREAIDTLVTTMSEDGVQIFETVHQAKDGRMIPVEIYSNIVMYKGKKAILSISRDISKRKSAEEKIRENEKMLSAALRGSISGSWEIDLNSMQIKYDKNWLIYLGYDSDFPVKLKNAYELLYPGNSKEMLNRIKECISSKCRFYESKNYLRKKDGTSIWVLCRGKVIEHDEKGNPVIISGINIDITEKELEEQKIREYESQFKAVFETTLSSILVFDDTKRIIMANNSAANMFGKSISSLLSVKIEDLNIRNYKNYTFDLKKYFRENIQRGECTFGKSKDETRIAYFDIVRVRNDFNLFMLYDITELKIMHEDLELSREKYFALYENAPIPYQSLDENGNFKDINPAWLKTTGYNRDEIIGKNFYEFLSTGDKAVFRKIFPKFKKQGLHHMNAQFRLKHKNGYLIDILMNCQVAFDSLKKIRHIYCVFHDITEQETAIKKLTESESRYRHLIDTSVDLIILTDENGKIIEANNTACKFTGLKKEKISNMNISEFRPEKFRKEIDVITSDLPINKSVIIDDFLLHSGMQIVPVEAVITKFQINKKIFFYRTYRDITGKKTDEENLRRELKEKEALLVAVHHRIKNNIASISGLLSLQANISDSNETKEALQNAMSRINCMKFLYDSLLLTEDYRGIPVKRYFENIINSLFTVYTDIRNLKVEKDIDDFFVEEKKLFPLGVIMEELVTNTVKYAFQNRNNPKIIISFKKKGNFVILKIQDNGIGVPSDFSENNGKKFGMMIVTMLAKQLKADFNVRNRNGAVFTLKIPV
ncbi:MAG: PAS domain S-box protein [Spirochaetes bacterium]|nr:PAS domain S-box protein [Spirochaetota bacterium]